MGGVRITAEDFGLEGPRGWAFRGIGADAPEGSLIAIEGPSGSGRTSLLLALTGRMKATEGTAAVGEARLPQQAAAVRRVSALAHVAGVTDLDPALTVGEHLHERALLQRRFGGSVRELLRPRAERAAETRLRVDTALTAAGLDREALPKGSRTAVRDLERIEALRLSVALALIGRPRLLGVDDTDLKLSEAERAEVWELLASIAASGTTVLAVCAEAPQDTVRLTTRPRPDDGPPPGDGDGPHEEPGRKPDDEPAPETALADPPTDLPVDTPADTPADTPVDSERPEPGEHADRDRHADRHQHPVDEESDAHEEETADALAAPGRA